jgi:hypothetical protein
MKLFNTFAAEHVCSLLPTSPPKGSRNILAVDESLDVSVDYNNIFVKHVARLVNFMW